MIADRLSAALAWAVLAGLLIAPAAAQEPPGQAPPYAPQEPATLTPQDGAEGPPTQAPPAAAPGPPLLGPPGAAKPPVQTPPMQMPPVQMPPPNQGNPQQNRQPAPPIVLTPQQEAYLDEVLNDWEKNTSDIRTFRSTFHRWQYIPGLLPANFGNKPGLLSTGELTYSAPDKGSFKITEIRRLNPQTGEYEVAKDEVGEHWVCDGRSIYEYNAKSEPKQVIERPLPPELQGKAITDGPLPFLFGAKAAKLKQRYFMQVITPEQYAKTEIWLDAYPRYRNDAANFYRAVLSLKRGTYEPYALRVYDPGDLNSPQKAYTSYEFESVKINDPLEKIRDLFAPPKVPFGWKKVVELPPQATVQPAAYPQR